MNEDELIDLLRRISSGEATVEEIHGYNDWINSFQLNRCAHPDKAAIRQEMLPAINRQIRLQRRKRRMRLWTKVAAVAAVLVVLAVGSDYVRHPSNVEPAINTQQQPVVPGGNKAILTLANGQQIVLEDAHNGQLVRQGHCQVTKADSGLLVYQSQPTPANDNRPTAGNVPAFNTLATDRGGQFQLILPDGTKVWLNSASSIRYPAVFTGKQRRVSITGEVFFEVAHDAQHPFMVSTRHSDITVLGTRFNVMAYENEPAVSTTLLDGAVKVSLPGQQTTVVLRPGQQANVKNAAGTINIKTVDAAGISAWIHGLLSLKDCSVQEFMNQLSRWYDVDVSYTDGIPKQRFGGMINRNAPLVDVLAALQTAGIQTKLQGRKLIVLSH